MREEDEKERGTDRLQRWDKREKEADTMTDR